MRHSLAAACVALGAMAAAAWAGGAQARDYLGAACTNPAPARCEGEACMTSGALADLGNATEPKTGRKFFLDYPCDLKPGEKVVFILNIHGAGSIGNWQRHYFPAIDDKGEVPPRCRDADRRDKSGAVSRSAGRAGVGLRGRRCVSAEHRDRGDRCVRRAEHQGVLAGGDTARAA